MEEVGNSNFISDFESYMIIGKKLFYMTNQLNITAIVDSYKKILIENISDIYLLFISLVFFNRRSQTYIGHICRSYR